MNDLLRQFLQEGREFLEEIAHKLMHLERDPTSSALITELFRLVHTLKGNSGLFKFPELTQVLHAAEDLLDAVRHGHVDYSHELADQLLEAMDFVSILLEEVDNYGAIHARFAIPAAAMSEVLRASTGIKLASGPGAGEQNGKRQAVATVVLSTLTDAPAETLSLLSQAIEAGKRAWSVAYSPAEVCFFNGTDPLLQIRQLPQVVWCAVAPRRPWPDLADMDTFRCLLDFRLLVVCDQESLLETFRYVADCVQFMEVINTEPVGAVADVGQSVPGKTGELPVDTEQAVATLLALQQRILDLPESDSWARGRVRSAAIVIAAIQGRTGKWSGDEKLASALADCDMRGDGNALNTWLGNQLAMHRPSELDIPDSTMPELDVLGTDLIPSMTAPTGASDTLRTARRTGEASITVKTLKVDQTKVDRLMNLIGEMVVAKNSLPYLANRAESVYGVRELAREIKTHYAVINRIAEEMQDAIMQVRMMPVHHVFQRFPRLVRDLSRQLGKHVNLVLEGEETEADKNIIEAIADPLIHLVRNSLDHGIEKPEVRIAAGKPAEGRLLIKARQETDRAIIEIADDGNGIDPVAIKRKALEKNLYDEAALERMSDQEAINLVFSAGFSTAESISDVSGRGVGMDVVRNAVEKVHGSLQLTSEVGLGTRIELSLPLSMAVTNVMIVESDSQIFGVPMDVVMETVRVPLITVQTIKQQQTALLRDRVVPLVPLNQLLALDCPQELNGDEELAVLVVRVNNEPLGIVVDQFRETVDIILKPLAGILGSLPGFAGSALLGDGSVLMVLNVKELV